MLKLLSVTSESPVSAVSRQYSGAMVAGCRPVIVTFRSVAVELHVTVVSA